MDKDPCPFRGPIEERRENGSSRWERHPLVSCRFEERGPLGFQGQAASARLDRLMSWVVGVFLVVTGAALVFIQAHPPRW